MLHLVTFLPLVGALTLLLVRKDDGAECAVGTVVCAVVDLERFKSRPVPPSVRALVADLVES